MTSPAPGPKNAVELLQRLVAIPSVNPDGDTTGLATGEKVCAEYVAEFLKGCGAEEVILEDVLPGRPNVIGHFPGPGGDKPRLLFGPHTDTVSVTGMTIDPFGGELRDGKIWGRGASDTKGTMAAMLWAFWELKDRWQELGANVSFAGFAGEETGQPGSRHFATHHADGYDFAVIGEPTSLNIVHAHKGCVWVTVRCRGKATHGSAPELGDNAISRMVTLLTEVDGALREELATYRNEVLGPSTVNIGTILGGHRANIVPDFCEAVLDFRFTQQLAAEGGPVPLLRKLIQKRPDADYFTAEPMVECGPLDTDVNDPFVKKMVALGAQPVGAPWFCDAAWLALAGVPAVAIGPGSIAQAHTEDEFLAVDDLLAGVEFYRRFIESF